MMERIAPQSPALSNCRPSVAYLPAPVLTAPRAQHDTPTPVVSPSSQCGSDESLDAKSCLFASTASTLADSAASFGQRSAIDCSLTASVLSTAPAPPPRAHAATSSELAPSHASAFAVSPTHASSGGGSSSSSKAGARAQLVLGSARRWPAVTAAATVDIPSSMDVNAGEPPYSPMHMSTLAPPAPGSGAGARGVPTFDLRRSPGASSSSSAMPGLPPMRAGATAARITFSPCVRGASGAPSPVIAALPAPRRDGVFARLDLDSVDLTDAAPSASAHAYGVAASSGGPRLASVPTFGHLSAGAFSASLPPPAPAGVGRSALLRHSAYDAPMNSSCSTISSSLSGTTVSRNRPMPDMAAFTAAEGEFVRHGFVTASPGGAQPVCPPTPNRNATPLQRGAPWSKSRRRSGSVVDDASTDISSTSSRMLMRSMDEAAGAGGGATNVTLDVGALNFSSEAERSPLQALLRSSADAGGHTSPMSVD
ncbi:hypothetical protein EON68_01810, partial [archaeon]